MDTSRENRIWNAGRNLSALIVEAYTWLMAVTFGMTLLDILYARVLREANAAVDPAVIFSDVSDILLWIGALSLLAAIAAIGVSWRSKSARNLFAASLLVVIGGSMIPLAIFLFLANTPLAQPGAGWWIRLSISGVASLLAFLGLRAFHRQS